MAKFAVLIFKEGTDTSGYQNHPGRPGRRGGSLPRGGAAAVQSLTADEEFTRARTNMINRLSYNVLEQAGSGGHDQTTARRLRRESRQPIGGYLDTIVDEYLNSSTLTADGLATRECNLGTISVIPFGDVPIDDSDWGPFVILLNDADATLRGQNMRAYAQSQSTATTASSSQSQLEADNIIFEGMYNRLGDIIPGHPDYNGQLAHVIDVVNTGSATELQDAIQTYDFSLNSIGTIRSDEAEALVRWNAVMIAQANGTYVQSSAAVATPTPTVAPTPAPAQNFTSPIAPPNNIRASVQTLANVYSSGGPTMRDAIQRATYQTLSRDDFESQIAGLGVGNTTELMNMYDFYHRAQPYTSYFNSSDEVTNTYSRLLDAADGSGTAAKTDMQALIDDAQNHTAIIGGFENAVNDWENTYRQLDPISRARISALWDQTQVRGTAHNSTTVRQPAQRRHVAPTPAAPVVPTINTQQDFNNYIENTISQTSDRSKSIAYRSIRAAVTGVDSTPDRLDSIMTEFDNTFPNTLTPEAKTAFKTSYALYHSAPVSLPTDVLAMPEDFQEFVDKAQHHQLVEEVKTTTHSKPLTVAEAVASESIFGSTSNINDMARVLKQATGKDIDPVEFVNDAYNNFEAGGIKVQVEVISTGQSSFEVQFGLLHNGRRVGYGKRTINSTGEIHNDLLKIENQSLQGQGFGSAFYKHTEDRYVRDGFKEITITANIDGGGYSWAAMGFENMEGGYAPGTKVPQHFIRDLTTAYGGPLPYIPKHIWEVAAYRKPGVAGEPGAIGKYLLRGTYWSAHKSLSDDDLGFAIGRAYYRTHSPEYWATHPRSNV